MVEVSVETGVDDLIRLLKNKGKIAQKDAAKELNINDSYIQSWIDFLVEEGIVGIEYKFTKPFIFLNSVDDQEEEKTSKSQGLSAIKEEYFQHAKDKKIPQEKIEQLWNNKLLKAVEKKKAFFQMEAKKRNLKEIDHLFEKYKELVQKV